MAKLHKAGAPNQTSSLPMVGWALLVCCLTVTLPGLRWGGSANCLLHLHPVTADKTDSKSHVREPHQIQHKRLLYSLSWYLKAFLRFLFNVSSWKQDYSLRLQSLRLFFFFLFFIKFFPFHLPFLFPVPWNHLKKKHFEILEVRC